VPIYMTRPPNRKTVADSDEHAAELEQLGFVRDDQTVADNDEHATEPKKRAVRKPRAAQQ